MNLRVFYLTRRGISDGYGFLCKEAYWQRPYFVMGNACSVHFR